LHLSEVSRIEIDPLSEQTILSFSALALLVGYLACKKHPRNDLLFVGLDVKPFHVLTPKFRFS